MKIKETNKKFSPLEIEKLKNKIPLHCQLCDKSVIDRDWNPPLFCTEVESDDWEEEHYHCDSFKISDNKLIDYLQKRDVFR